MFIVVLVILMGIFGVVLGFILFNLMGIKDMVVRGFVIGMVLYGIGIVRVL